MPKKVAIIQSNYIPWKGFFDMINMVDEFVFYDDVQYTKKDWRNRNKIKTPNGLIWLTIPVIVKNSFEQKIYETKVEGMHWKKKHLKSIIFNYSQANHFNMAHDFIIDLYEHAHSQFLCEINYYFIQRICEFLKIKTPFLYSQDFKLSGDRTERVVDLCQQLNATHLINGPSAKEHMNERLFSQAGIQVMYMDYTGYPEYPQPFSPFEHKVSIVDVILNTGKNAPKFMKSF